MAATDAHAAVEDLGDGDAAAAGRVHPVDVETTVLAVRGCLRQDPVCREVGCRHLPRPGVVALLGVPGGFRGVGGGKPVRRLSAKPTDALLAL